MSKIKIEIQITLLLLVIGAAVVTSGYFAYKSLSNIVYTIHQGATPDYKLFVIKDLAVDLASLENNVRLYILTNKNENLHPFEALKEQITFQVNTLNDLPVSSEEEAHFTDSLSTLAIKKMELWQSILTLHQSAQNLEPTFSEIYSKIEESKLDTIETELEKKGFLRKIFGGKKIVVDTTVVERDLGKEELKLEIQNLETEIKEKGQEKNILESQLIEENIILVRQINELVAKAEKNENDKLIGKTREADRLAAQTYERLAAFTVTAVILLLVVLFVLFSYLKKSRAYQKALKEAKLEAEMLARAREKFAANVSHELRTPVNAIYGLTEQLCQEPLENKTKELVTVLSKSAIHLKSVINDTLDFSKIQANKLKLDSLDFSPSDIFNEVLALQKFDAIKKGIALTFSWKGERPEALVGDPLRLKQILINLLGNAIKFTQNGEVTVEVEVAPAKKNIYDLFIQVADTGIGMTPENLKIIFDEYVQAENSEGIKYQGTGLGLSIVKKLVELHNGTVSVESEPGKGARFKIHIRYPEGKKENIAENGFETPEIPEVYKKLTLLIADDAEFNRFLLKGILKKWGVAFHEATNGNEAVETALLFDFDVIFMDLRMPGKNGIEATKAILREKPEARIIAISASNEHIDKQECIKAGMSGFLSKPFSERSLLTILNSILDFESIAKKDTKPALVNISELERLANGDTHFLKEMVHLFILSSENGINTIHNALQTNELKIIHETAHKMAAPCKHLQAMNLYDKIKKIETMAWNQEKPDKIKPLFFSVKADVENIILQLKKYLDEREL